MCKLCNTDRPPIKNSTYPELLIVKDYIREFPCKQCYSAITAAKSSKVNFDLDKYLLKKLFTKYRTMSPKDIWDAKNYKNQIIKTKFGIKIYINIKTNTHSYYPMITINGKSIYIGQVEKSLQKALQAKLKYMVKHNHTKGLKILQTKIRKLENEN